MRTSSDGVPSQRFVATLRQAVTALLLVSVVVLVPTPARAALLNPGFETGDLTDWDSSGDVQVLSCALMTIGCAPSGGAYSAGLNETTGFGNASLRQVVSVAGAGMYDFGAWVSYGANQAAGNFAQGQVSLTVEGAGVSAVVGFDPNALQGQFTTPGGPVGFSYTPWFLLTGTLNYGGVGPADLLINLNVQNFSTENGLILVVDNAFVTATSVPEPATFALLGVGLLGLRSATRTARRR